MDAASESAGGSTEATGTGHWNSRSLTMSEQNVANGHSESDAEETDGYMIHREQPDPYDSTQSDSDGERPA